LGNYSSKCEEKNLRGVLEDRWGLGTITGDAWGGDLRTGKGRKVRGTASGNFLCHSYLTLNKTKEGEGGRDRVA